jgi:tetratricopeptide (TPR) repeat protein
MLLLDYFFARKLFSKKVFFEKLPLFALSIVFGIITLSNAGTMRNLTQGMMVSYNGIDIFFMVCYSFAFYFIKLFLPVNLCAVYVYPPKDNGLLPWEYYASAVLLVAVLFALFKFRNNKNIILCAGLFLITIAINIQIIPSRLFIVTDRYAYFPYIGLFMLPVFYFANLKQTRVYFYNKYFPYMITVLVILGIFFSYQVYERNKVWKDDITFMTDILEKNPPVPYIYRAYGNRGMAHKLRGQNQEAINDFTEAMKLDKTDSRTYYNRALTFATMNRNEEALADFTTAIKLDSSQSLLYSNRAQVRFLLKDTLGAEADCKKTIELDPKNIDAYNTLANVDFAKKDYLSCEKNLTAAIKIKPDFSIAIKNRGLLYLQMNRKDDACSDFLNASNLNNQEAKQMFSQYCK